VLPKIDANSLTVDALIDDLLSTAVDELTQFAAMTEMSTGKYERDVRHRVATSRMHGGTDTAESPWTYWSRRF
jgi:hypothetical protein